MSQSIEYSDTTYTLPFDDLLPALDSASYEELRDDISARGIVVPVIIDEHKNVLDGGHRLRIAAELELEDIPIEIRPGLSDDEKQQLAWDLNAHRRHMTREQRRELAVKLRQQGESQRAIAEKLGVSQDTVRNDISSVTASDRASKIPEIRTVKGRDGKTYRYDINKRRPPRTKRYERDMPRHNSGIYFIRSAIGGPIKIGYSKNHTKRIQTIQAMSPFKLGFIATMKGTRELEAELHSRFSSARLHGEWFEPTDELLEFVKRRGE